MAKNFINSKEYLWNSEIYCFKAGSFLNEMEQHAPIMLKEVSEYLNLSKTSDANHYIESKLNFEHFTSIKDNSIDYELMEKSRNLMVIPSSFTWQDMGCWESYSTLHAPDASENRVKGFAVLKNTKKNIVVIGVNNLTIVNSADGILIADKNHSSEIKNLFFEEINKKNISFLEDI